MNKTEKKQGLRENPYGVIFEELEGGLWEHEARVGEGRADPYPYTDDQFRACLKIFMSGVMWKLFEKGEKEHGHCKGLEARAAEAERLGTALRDIILEFTGIDAHKLYEKEEA